MKKDIKSSDIGLVTEEIILNALPSKDYFLVYRWIKTPEMTIKLGTLARLHGQKRQWYWHILKVLLFSGLITKKSILAKGFTDEQTINKWIKLYIEEIVSYSLLLKRNVKPKRSMLHEHVQELLEKLIKTKRKMI